MILHGVYSRMDDGDRRTPFRNRAQIMVSATSLTYSTHTKAGEIKRVLPIQWHGDIAFTVDWRRVCSHWSESRDHLSASGTSKNVGYKELLGLP